MSARVVERETTVGVRWRPDWTHIKAKHAPSVAVMWTRIEADAAEHAHSALVAKLPPEGEAGLGAP